MRRVIRYSSVWASLGPPAHALGPTRALYFFQQVTKTLAQTSSTPHGPPTWEDSLKKNNPTWEEERIILNYYKLWAYTTWEEEKRSSSITCCGSDEQDSMLWLAYMIGLLEYIWHGLWSLYGPSGTHDARFYKNIYQSPLSTHRFVNRFVAELLNLKPTGSACSKLSDIMGLVGFLLLVLRTSMSMQLCRRMRPKYRPRQSLGMVKENFWAYRLVLLTASQTQR